MTAMRNFVVDMLVRIAAATVFFILPLVATLTIAILVKGACK